MTMGKALHAYILRLICNVDPTMGEELHDLNQLKPFTISPIQGPVTVQGRSLLFHQTQDYWFRVTSYEAQVSHCLGVLEAQPPAHLRLLQGDFIVQRVTSDHRAHPWAHRSSYEALYEAMQHQALAATRLALTFLSPTAFRSQGRTLLLPLPRLIFTSLLERWNRYAPFPLPPVILEAVEAGVDLTRYTLRTQMLDFDRYRQAGFVGDCEFLVHRDLPAALRQHLELLAAFALFSGVGYKTTMGMGQVRQVV
jgi:CRISPR-associated endoribonuclease Cas6